MLRSTLEQDSDRIAFLKHRGRWIVVIDVFNSARMVEEERWLLVNGDVQYAAVTLSLFWDDQITVIALLISNNSFSLLLVLLHS